jgi:hypothetical protein
MLKTMSIEEKVNKLDQQIGEIIGRYDRVEKNTREDWEIYIQKSILHNACVLKYLATADTVEVIVTIEAKQEFEDMSSVEVNLAFQQKCHERFFPIDFPNDCLQGDNVGILKIMFDSLVAAQEIARINYAECPFGVKMEIFIAVNCGQLERLILGRLCSEYI